MYLKGLTISTKLQKCIKFGGRTFGKAMIEFDYTYLVVFEKIFNSFNFINVLQLCILESYIILFGMIL